MISSRTYSRGVDRGGAGDLDGHSGPPGLNFHPNFSRQRKYVGIIGAGLLGVGLTGVCLIGGFVGLIGVGLIGDFVGLIAVGLIDVGPIGGLWLRVGLLRVGLIGTLSFVALG